LRTDLGSKTFRSKPCNQSFGLKLTRAQILVRAAGKGVNAVCG
jgi:hypothetical protein